MAEFLYDEFDVKISLVTVWRALAEARWSRKVASKAARERNETLRRIFQARVQAYRSDQVICLDESACNERTGDRKYGWSPVHNPIQLEYSAKRSERWSLLPALTEDGCLAHTIFQGAITAERLYEFVANQVLPHMNPYPMRRSVLVLDNASIRHSAEFKQLCHEAIAFTTNLSLAIGNEFCPAHARTQHLQDFEDQLSNKTLSKNQNFQISPHHE